MERSIKRFRIGPSPFDCDDDDELNSRPEEVNLRRDPGYQFQKSRSFAAFKLKSRFEDIFAKYEKDFTDVGDEILLSTGEIAVNNGHLESLKDQRYNDKDQDGDGDEVEEEERILQGKHLSLALTSLPLTLQPRAPVSPAQWQPGAHVTGGSPMLSTMLPGQMPLGNFGAFPPPISPSFDPVWNAPPLPMPAFGSPFGPAPRLNSTQLLIAPANADDEDDILLGVSTKEKSAVPKPPRALGLLENGPSSEKENVPASSEPRPGKPVTTMAMFRRPPEPPKKTWSRQKRLPKTPLQLTASASPATHSSPSTRPKTRGRPRTRKSGGAGTPKGKETDLDTSSPEKVADKPTNQRLQVEIRVMKKLDASSYRIITPEPTLDAEPAQTAPQVNSEAVCLAAEPTQTAPQVNSETVCPALEPTQIAPQVNTEAVCPALEPTQTAPQVNSEAVTETMRPSPQDYVDNGDATMSQAMFAHLNPIIQGMASKTVFRTAQGSVGVGPYCPAAEPTQIAPQVNTEAVCPAAETMGVEKALPSPPIPATKDEQVAPSPAEPKEKGSKQMGQCPSPPAEVFSRNTLDPDYAFSDEDEPTLSRARVERQKSVASQRSCLKGCSSLEAQPVAWKQRRRAKKPSGAVKSALESISEDTDDTIMAEEVAEEEAVTESPIEVNEEEPDTDDTVMADEVAEEEREQLETVVETVVESNVKDTEAESEHLDTVAETQVDAAGPELEKVAESQLEVTEKEPEQPETVVDSQVEATEKEPEQPEMVMESQALPILDIPAFDLPSPMASDPAFPPTSSPTRSKVERRATGHPEPTPEPTIPSSNQAPSSPFATPLENDPTTIPDPELPTERRKRKLSPTSEEELGNPPPRRPSPFSSPGRIPRDQIIPETPDASSSAAIPHHSPRHRSPSPELGFRDPSPVFSTATLPLPKNPVTLTLNPKQQPFPPPAPQTPSSKTTTRRVPRSGSILSLVDDDADKDELAPSPSSFPAQPTPRHSTPRTRTSVSQSGASVRSFHTPSNKSKSNIALRRLAATVGRRSRSNSLMRDMGTSRDRGGVVSSPLGPRWSRGTPGVEVVQTPGGTKRRCGEGGWRCERDFCFVCL